jgi:hypothetical protein
VGTTVDAGALSIPLVQMAIGFASDTAALGMRKTLAGLAALRGLIFLIILRIFRSSPRMTGKSWLLHTRRKAVCHTCA